MSDDEIASYDPTTPFKVVPVKNQARSNKPNGPTAGPSSKPASRTTGTKRKNNNTSPEPSDSDDLYGPQAPAEDEALVMPPEKKPKKGQAPVGVPVNGKATSKGKAKAEPLQKPSRKATERIDVDDIAVDEETEMEVVARPSTRATATKSNKTTSTTARIAKTTDKELSRLRQKLVDAEAQRDALSAQLEELLQVRHTAAEESLDHQSLQYEARLHTQEKLIQELTSQLARVEPLARSGKTSLLHFLTRDAADEEQRGLENEIHRWKDIAKAKEAIIAEKDRRIAELERTERDVRYELNAEIERSKTLASKAIRSQPPGSGSRGRIRGGGGILGADDPRNAAVIKFYEDLTNLLVPNLKFEPGKYLGLEETCFTCIYTYMDLTKTHNDESERGEEKSLTFTLRFYHDLIVPEDQRTPADEHVTSADQLVQSIKYTPLELDKESDEFVQKLRFLGEAFTFGRDQLALFLKTMYDTLGGAVQDDEEEMEVEDGV